MPDMTSSIAPHRSGEPSVNILLVDDQPANLLALEAILSPLGYRLVRAASGAEALECLRQEDFAAVLLDVQMAGLSGFETAERIRSQERSRPTPIIFLTAYESSDFPVVEAYRLGAVDYLLKPLVPDILRAKVSGFVELFVARRRAEQALRTQRQQLEVTLASIGDAVIVTDAAGRITFLNPVAQALTGWPSEQALGQPIESVFHIVNETTRQRPESPVAQVIQDGTLRRLANHTLLIARDGSERPIDNSGGPIRDADGGLIGVVLVFRDISERRRAERRLLAQLATARILTEATTLEEAAPRVLEAACENLGWDLGQLWRTDDNTGLLCGIASWHRADPKLAEFARSSAEFAFPPGTGLPGRVWASGEAAWISDVVHNDNFPRRAIAARSGLHGACGLPIRRSGGVVGVLEVFGRDVRPRDANVLEGLRAIGAQLSQFLERIRAETDAWRSEARKAAVVETALDAIITMNHEGRVVEWNPAAERTFGHRRADVLGQEIAPLIIPRAFQAAHREGLSHYLDTEEGPILNRRLEWTAVRADGTEIPVELTITRIPTDGPPLFTAYVRDLTERHQAERQRRQSEAQFRALADSVAQLAWMARPDGYIFWYNRRWYEYTGTTPEQMEGWGWQSVHDPAVLPQVMERWQTCIATGQPFDMVFPLRGADGQFRPFLTRINPLRDETGQVLYWFGTNTDISEQKRAEDTARFLADASAALASVGDYQDTLTRVAELAVPFFADWCTVDMVQPDGTLHRLAVVHGDPAKVEWAREGYRRYPPRPDVPHGPSHVLRTGRPEMAEEVADEQLRALAQDADHLQILRELGLRSYLSVPLVVRGRTLGVLSFATAESGRRYRPADLKLAEDLAHRAAVAIDNARLYAELREANQHKDEFLAVLAHELRNPLTPVRNALYVMKQPHAQPADLQQARDMAERQIGHMARLLEDLLDVARIGRGHVELRKEIVDVAALVRRTAEAVRPLLADRRHKISVTLPAGPLTVEADPVRLEQILTNLLHNAVKYTDPGGHIWLIGERDGREVVLRVRDTGIGIAAEMLPRIFDLFVQAERRLDRSQGGVGIGLTLVKQLVELHGGSIVARSPGVGQGSEFIIRLPAAPGPDDGRDRESRPGEVPRLPQRRVLVVDDSPDAADSLALVLRLAGQEVRTAYDGPSALAQAAEFRPELVFLDIGMPGMDGYEVARRLRAIPAVHGVMLVALTGWGQDEDRRRSREAGFDCHLVKPAELGTVEALLAGLKPSACQEPQRS